MALKLMLMILFNVSDNILDGKKDEKDKEEEEKKSQEERIDETVAKRKS